jgi:predicted ATP-grasp superfamily ATP-dependent carboligase
MRVLVTDAEVRKSLAVVRGLGERHHVLTASSSRPAMAAWSKYSKAHLLYRWDESFPDWLVAAVQEHGVDALVCPQEKTMLLAAQVYDRLEAAGTRVTFPRLPVIDRAFDKGKTLAIAQEVGVPIPRTVFLDHPSDAATAAREIGFPLIVKQRYSSYWNGTEFIAGEETQYARRPVELERIIEKHDSRLPLPMLQEFVPGSGLGVFLLLDREGRTCAEFAHRRIRDIRPTGSASVLRESVPVDGRLRELAEALLGKMEWWGVAMVEFRTDERTGGVALMEVNGRFWGSLQLALDAGVNFPEILIDVVSGESPTPPTFRPGIKVRWWLGDLARTASVLKGRPTGFSGRFPTRWSAVRDMLGPQPTGTKGEVYRAGDRWPAAAELLSRLKAVL